MSMTKRNGSAAADNESQQLVDYRRASGVALERFLDRFAWFAEQAKAKAEQAARNLMVN